MIFTNSIRITIDLMLAEGNDRAKTVSKRAFVYLVGLGLGNVLRKNHTFVYVYLFSLKKLFQH